MNKIKLNNNKKNLITSITVQFVNMMVGLLLPRLIIQNYGSVLNGLVSSSTQIVSYLSLVEMGLYSASIVAFYGPIAVKNENDQTGVFRAVSDYYKRISLLFFVGTILVSVFYPFFIKDDISVVTICSMVISVGMVNVVTYLCLGKYKAFLQANNQLYIVNTVHIVGYLIYCALSVCAIALGYSIICTRISLVLSLLIEFFFLRIYCKKKYAYLLKKITPKRDAIKQRKDILVHQVSSLVLNSTDVVLLTILGKSLSLVSVYSMYNMVANIALGLSNGIMSSETASFGQLLALDSRDILKDKVFKFELWYDICIFTIHVSMAVLITPFVRIYTKGITDVNYDQYIIGMLFSLCGICKVLRLPYSEMIHAKGHYKQTNPQQYISTTINIILTIILIPFLGIVGALIGTFVSEVTSSILLMYYCYKNIIQYRWKTSIARLVLNIILAISIIIVLNDVILSFSPEDYSQFFALAIMVGIVVGGLFLLSNLLMNIIIKKCININ